MAVTDKTFTPLAQPKAVSHESGMRDLTPELATEFRAVAAANPSGLIQAEAVLERAENPMSPLHEYFEWDDEKAARALRVMQARYLIRSFRIEVEPLVIVPAFVSLGENRQNGGGYSWTAEVLPKQDMRLSLILTVLGDIENMLHKIEDFVEVQSLRKAISSTREHLTPKQ